MAYYFIFMHVSTKAPNGINGFLFYKQKYELDKLILNNGCRKEPTPKIRKASTFVELWYRSPDEMITYSHNFSFITYLTAKMSALGKNAAFAVFNTVFVQTIFPGR